MGLVAMSTALAQAACAVERPAVPPAAPAPAPATSSATAQPGAAATSGTPTATSAPTAVRTATASPRPTASATKKPVDRRRGAHRANAFVVNGVEVVSKRHPITSAYRRSSVAGPYGLTEPTQAALTRMIAAARRQRVTVRVRSGYRSYAEQADLLVRKIAEYGDEGLARRYVAAAGRSEHQTGLAVDLWDGTTWGTGVRNTRAGKWLWSNAWRFGFVLRYPRGKERITGYAFEPWHYRYVGTGHARRFGARSHLSLEEYLGLA